MKNRNSKYPLVLIEWEDSVGGRSGWKPIADEPKETIIATSVGYLVHKDKKSHVIFSHVYYLQEEEYEAIGQGDMRIPTSAIKRVVNLREQRK